MTDPYWRYASTDRDTRASFPGYLPSHAPSVASHGPWNASDRVTSDLLQDNSLRTGAYNFDDLAAIGSRATPGIGGLTAGAGVGRLTSPLQDPALLRRDSLLGVSPVIADIERPTLRKSEGLRGDESNMLFVDGLPNDCTRREVGHLFRPFIGFKDIRLFHKEARWSGDTAHVLCFVEFDDAKCAMTALDALQGYKFDDKKPDAPILKIQLAHFPLRIHSQHRVMKGT